MSSAGRKRTTFKSPEDLTEMCRHVGSEGIAFTYNEPSIWFEYIKDVKACDPDLDIVLVSNGLINENPLKELCSITSAVNIDIKGFNDRFYSGICGAHLQNVLDSAETVKGAGVHMELTYLVIPGYNDSQDEIEQFSNWVHDDLSPNVPVHFTRFHPDYLMTDVPITPADIMIHCRTIGIEAGLEYVYTGNMIAEGTSDTVCPECGTTVVKRTGYLVKKTALRKDGRCSVCGHDLNIIIRWADIPV